MFTWNNRRVGNQQIASRLDQFLLSDNVIHIGGDFSSSILPLSGSDHWPISLQWSRPRNKIRGPFHFEAFWMSHTEFQKLINSEWKNFTPPPGSKMFQFQQNLKNLKGKIKHWNHTSFGNIFQGKSYIELEVKQLQQRIIDEGHSEELSEQEKTLDLQLVERVRQEETLWRQKSRVRWLRYGEKNTKFFHSTTIQRRMHNNITHIQNEQGTKVEKHEEIEGALLHYLKQMHREPNGDRSQAIEKITRNIPKLITDEHNQLLLKPVDLQEVEQVVR